MPVKQPMHWTAFVIACWFAAFLGSYTYDACVRIYHAFEDVTIPGPPALDGVTINGSYP
jgi:hypothetical protein